jgi:outer membrane protein assembly factor BamB
MDRGDGETRWNVFTDTELRVPPVSYDGSVYVAGEAVVSVDSGTERWRTSLPGVASAMAVDATTDVVVVGTEHGTVTAVNGDDSYFVDADDGDRRWQTQVTTGGDPARIDALAAGGGVVYAGSRDGVAVALDVETGEERWRTGSVTSTIASTGSEVLIGRRQVTSVRAGQRQWSVTTENDWTTDITSADRWYLTGSRVEGDGYVLALSPDGEKRWRHRLLGDGVALTPAVDGRFVVGVEGDRPGVHQFTIEGDSAWFFETETSVVDVVYTGDRAWGLTASGRVVALSR